MLYLHHSHYNSNSQGRVGRPFLLAGNENFLQGKNMLYLAEYTSSQQRKKKFTFQQFGYEETALQSLKFPSWTDCYYWTLTGLRSERGWTVWISRRPSARSCTWVGAILNISADWGVNELSPVEKDLRIVVDENKLAVCTWTQKANITRSIVSRAKEAILLLYSTLMRSHLQYCIQP